MKALYLEPDEEITSAIDRLREIEEEDVAIVIPKRAAIIQSIINLKLLRHQAEGLKKKISIVTTDKTGRNLASAVGLTVYQRMPEGTEVKESVVHEPGTPVPIKFKRGSGQTEQSVTPPAVQTKSVSDPETPPAPVIMTPAPEPVETASTITAEPPPVAETPKSRRSLSKISLPRPKLPGFKMPKGLGGFGGRGLLIALAVLLAGGGLLAAFLLPKAVISVTPKADPLSADVPITFSAKAQAPDVAGHVVPAKPIEVTLTATTDTAATGTAGSGDKAKGDITVVNTLSKNQPLVARTRFQAPNGGIFRSQAAVVVPAGGQTTVSVVADDGGEDGNLQPGTKLSIPGLGGSASVYGQVDTALGGGSSGQGAKQVSAADADRGKTELAQKAATDGLDQAKAKLAVGYKLNEQVAATSVLSSTTSPKVGTTADRFTASGSVKVTYFTYHDEDVQNIVSPALKAKVPAGSDLVDGTPKETFSITSASADSLVGTMKASTFASNQVSRDQIKEAVAGKSPEDAIAQLKRSGQADNVTVKLSPFWVHRIPNAASKIEIRFVAGSSGASPAPTPAASTSPTPTVTTTGSQPPSI